MAAPAFSSRAVRLALQSLVERLAVAMVLTEDILEVFGNRKSRDFYNYAAVKLADYEQDVRFLLGSFKQGIVNNPHTQR